MARPNNVRQPYESTTPAEDAKTTPHRCGRKYHWGLLLTGLATLAAVWVSEWCGAPLTLAALLIGLALNFLNTQERLMPGLNLASGTLLRLGIMLIGAQVTFGQMAALGPVSLLAIGLILVSTMICGTALARRLGCGATFGTLAGGAVAICGASAAMALVAILGERQVNRSQLTLVLIGISAASSLAMLLYPLAAHAMGLSDVQAGFLIGASVHDVAQALGAGYAFSELAGDTAAIVKLTRVALLPLVLAIVARLYIDSRREGLAAARMPWFVVGFFVFAAANSAGVVPSVLRDVAQYTATALLACAVTATGISSPLRGLLQMGPGPLLVIAGSSVTAFALATLAACFIIS